MSLKKHLSTEKKEIIAVLLWAGMIFGFSSVPNLSSGLSSDFFLRKIAHAAEFAVLAYLIWRVLARRTKRRYFLFSTVCVLAIAYAFSDEGHQYFVPGRNSALVDVAIDSLGILFSCLVLLMSSKVKVRFNRALLQ